MKTTRQTPQARAHATLRKLAGSSPTARDLRSASEVLRADPDFRGLDISAIVADYARSVARLRAAAMTAR